MIYVIKAVGTEFVKIGISKSYGERMSRISSLQVGCPFELVLIAQADWPHTEERRIHSRLKRAGLHVRGEWFSRHGETDSIVELLRDGQRGLDEWHKRLRTIPNRRLARVFSITIP